MALRDRPIIQAGIDRIKANHPIAAAIAEGVQDAVGNPNNALTANDAPAVAAAVTDALARSPEVQNATNQEAWWKSRIWVGIITAAVGALLARLDIQFTANEQTLINQITPYIPQALGLAIAAIGRGVGARKGPINWRRPWTVFGIGR